LLTIGTYKNKIHKIEPKTKKNNLQNLIIIFLAKKLDIVEIKCKDWLAKSAGIIKNKTPH